LELVVKGEKNIIDPEDEKRLLAQARAGARTTGGAASAVDGSLVPLPSGRIISHTPGTVNIEDTPFVRNRKYRDCVFAIMASMYVLLRPDVHHRLRITQIQSQMHSFTDHQVAYNYRDRSFGAIQSIKEVVKKGLAVRHTGGMVRILLFFHLIHMSCSKNLF
jgi:hypothetical protein